MQDSVITFNTLISNHKSNSVFSYDFIATISMFYKNLVSEGDVQNW